jgi:hypothetical protein
LLGHKWQRHLIANRTLEEMRLLDGTAAQWPRVEHRIPERRFVRQTRGCFGRGRGDLRSKHGCTLTSLRGHVRRISVASELVKEF